MRIEIRAPDEVSRRQGVAVYVLGGPPIDLHRDSSRWGVFPDRRGGQLARIANPRLADNTAGVGVRVCLLTRLALTPSRSVPRSSKRTSENSYSTHSGE